MSGRTLSSSLIRNRALTPLLGLLLGACRGRDGGPESETQRSLTAIPLLAPVQSFGGTTGDAAFAEHSSPSVAHGAGIFLTVWLDRGNDDIYAVRTRASDGMVLDQRRKRLVATGDFQASPAVMFDGQNFLLLWRDSQRLLGLHVRPDGSIVEATPLVLQTGRYVGQMTVALGGDNVLVVWTEQVAVPGGGAQFDIFGARFRASDGMAVGTPIAIATRSTVEHNPAVAYDGSNFLVVWQDERVPPAIYANRVRASDGALLDGTDGFQVDTRVDATRPSVAFDGTNYLVAWQESFSTIRGTRLRASDRGKLDPSDLVFVAGSASTSGHSPRLSWDGTHYVMVWWGGASKILATRIDATTGAVLDGSGTLLDTPATAISGDYRHIYDAAVGSGRIFVTWEHQRDPNSTPQGPYLIDLFGAMIDPASGAVDKAAFLLSRSGHWQEQAVASSDGATHLVAWHEWNGEHFEVRGARVSNQDGLALDPAGFTISASPTRNQLYPRTASNGSNHLVVWCDGNTLRAARIKATDGSLLDGAGIALPATPGPFGWDSPRFSVASNGTDYLVFWIEGDSYTAVHARAVRVRGSDGAVLDTTPRVVAPDAPRRYYARLAFSGSHYVAVWLQGASGLDVMAVRLSSDGTVLDATPRLVSSASGFTKEPMLAGDGENMLIAWLDNPGERARRLRLSDGTLVDAADLTLKDHAGYSNLTFDGDNFVVVWPRFVADNQPWELLLTRLSRAGAPLDPTDTLVAPVTPGYPVSPASLSVGAGGRVLVTYQEYDDSADLQTERVRVRLAGVPPAPPDAAPPTLDTAAPGDDASPPTIDAATPTDQASADAGVVTMPDAGGAGNDAPVSPGDGAIPATDSAGSNLDAPTGGADAKSPQDAGAPASDGPPTATADGAAGADATGAAADTGNSSDATPARDGAAEGPGGGTGCDCRMGRRSQPASPGGLALVALLLVARRTRRARINPRSPARPAIR